MMDGGAVGSVVFAAKETVVYVCWGGVLQDGGNDTMTYVGGNTRCVWVSQGMGVEDVWKLLEGVVREGVKDQKMWYNLKYDQRLMIELQSDADLRSLIWGNDAHAYLYITGVGEPHTRPVELTEQRPRRDCDGTMTAGVQLGGCLSGVVAEGQA